MQKYPPWADNYETYGDRRAVRIGTIVSGNDGDVTNSVVTFECLKGHPRPFCIDIGCAEGWWTAFVKMICPNAQLISFEPNHSAYTKLRDRFQDASGVLILPYAVSNRHGILPFTEAGEASNSRDSACVGGVPCVFLQPFLKPRVDFLKIDVEGHEPQILYSLENDFNKIQTICFEFTPKWCLTPGAAIDLLEMMSRHYSFMAHLSRRHEIKLYPLQSREDRLKLVEWCVANNHQTDIVVSKEAIVLPDEW